VEIGDDGVNPRYVRRQHRVVPGLEVRKRHDGVRAGLAQGGDLTARGVERRGERVVGQRGSRQLPLELRVYQTEQPELDPCNLQDLMGPEQPGIPGLHVRREPPDLRELARDLAQAGRTQRQLELEGDRKGIAQAREGSVVDARALDAIHPDIGIALAQVHDEGNQGLRLALGQHLPEHRGSGSHLSQVRGQLVDSSSQDVNSVHLASGPGGKVLRPDRALLLDDDGGLSPRRAEPGDGDLGGDQVGELGRTARVAVDHRQEIGARLAGLLDQNHVVGAQGRDRISTLGGRPGGQQGRQLVALGFIRGEEDGDAGRPPAEVTHQPERQALGIGLLRQELMLVLSPEDAQGAQAGTGVDDRDTYVVAGNLRAPHSEWGERECGGDEERVAAGHPSGCIIRRERRGAR